MTDKEIIKALAIHINGKYNCTGCPYIAYNDCSDKIVTDSLDLIKRQQAEIEICAEVIKRQDKDIEKLNEFANERLDKFTERYDRNLKAEAIKEFVDRLGNYKEYRYNENCGFVPYVRLSDIDKVVKEMVGAEK